jgi:outer membrane protein TolC
MAGRTATRRVGWSRWYRAPHIPSLSSLSTLWRPALKVALAAGLLAESAGCTRHYYRKQADKEVSEILAQKDKYEAWRIENWHVYPDPRARFADPTNPDRPPMPPDDPAAYDLSPNPQKPPHAGIARVEGTGYLDLIALWDRENREKLAQREAEEKKETAPPSAAADTDKDGGICWRAATGTDQGRAEESEAGQPGEKVDVVGPIPKTEPQPAATATSLDISKRRPYLLTMEQAADLGMFNSREFQDRRENLYLAALPVSLERFAFGAQAFLAEQAIRSYTGRNTPNGQQSSWALNSGVGVSKLLPTGALLLLNFSNQTVFDFLNPKKTLSGSTLNFEVIQPLLRGGGKAVTLEPLTLAERNLLYQIRLYARFRKEFYASIAGGAGGSISGGSFQPTGVLSATPVPFPTSAGSGLFPGTIPAVTTVRTSPQVTPGQSGQAVIVAAITAPPSGYLTTMLQYVQIYIDLENIDTLTDILKRYEGLLEGDVVAPVQVQQVEQQLLGARNNLITDQQQYLDSLDRFKIQVGVPTALDIELDDAQLRPLLQQFRRSRAIIEQEHAASDEVARFNTLAAAPRLRAELLRQFEQSALSRGTAFAKGIRARWAAWEKLSDKELKQRLDDLRLESRRLMDLQAELQAKDQVMKPADLARLAAVNADFDVGNFERLLRQYEADYTEAGKPKKADPATERRRVTQFRDVTSLWAKIMVEARDERLSAVRQSWPELPRCCVDGVDLLKGDLARAETAAAQHALNERLDLMNVRGQVVDSWRQVAVFANALLGTFNVQYQLSSNSPIGHAQPLNIGGSGNAHQLTLNTDLPIVRKVEQNNYRESLIAYQRQRRALQEAEDFTVQAVRGELHVLRELAESYKIQQRQLELAYVTLDSSLEALQAPPRVAPAGAAAAAGGADGPAAQTQQILSAQRSLPQAQNQLLTVWINYLNTRLQLYRDLELMPLDARGVWIDEIRACDCGLEEPGKPGGPGLPPAGDAERLPEPRPVPPAAGPGLE